MGVCAYLRKGLICLAKSKPCIYEVSNSGYAIACHPRNNRINATINRVVRNRNRSVFTIISYSQSTRYANEGPRTTGAVRYLPVVISDTEEAVELFFTDDHADFWLSHKRTPD